MLIFSFGISMESGGVCSQTSFKEQSVMWEGDVTSVTHTTANRNHCQPGFCAIDSFEACFSHNNTYTGSVWELTRWRRDSSLSAVTPFMGCCIGATFILLQTPTKWHLLLLSVGQLRQRKPAGSLKRRGRQCDHLPPSNQQGCWESGLGPNPSCFLTACRTGQALLALSLKLFTRLDPWLHSLNTCFYGKRLLSNFFVSIVRLWTTFFLASSQAPVWESWYADAKFQNSGIPKILQPVPETETLHERDFMQGKTNPFIIMVIFFCLFTYFSSANCKMQRLGRSSLLPPLWGNRPQKICTLKNVRWTAAFYSETDHLNSKKLLCSGHFEIIFFWSNYVLAVKLTQLWLLSTFPFFHLLPGILS